MEKNSEALLKIAESLKFNSSLKLLKLSSNFILLNLVSQENKI